MPTEDEWYRLVDFCDVKEDTEANIVRGNIWQWSETPIYPYEGFEVHPLYDDFSTPTFDTRHNLIKGGSWISTGNETLLSARYAFRRHFYQHAGFRYVESDDLVSQYIEFGWGEEALGVANYPATCAALADFGLSESAKKVTFWQADACNLKPLYTGYDLIFAGNLIDRLYDPEKFLIDLAHRLNSGGILVLTSPYTWLEEFTPKSKWLGGYKREGQNITTLEGLKEILESSFTLVDTKDIPFVIKETQRKHQHTIAQMSVWEKKS